MTAPLMTGSSSTTRMRRAGPLMLLSVEADPVGNRGRLVKILCRLDEPASCCRSPHVALRCLLGPIHLSLDPGKSHAARARAVPLARACPAHPAGHLRGLPAADDSRRPGNGASSLATSSSGQAPPGSLGAVEGEPRTVPADEPGGSSARDWWYHVRAAAIRPCSPAGVFCAAYGHSHGGVPALAHGRSSGIREPLGVPRVRRDGRSWGATEGTTRSLARPTRHETGRPVTRQTDDQAADQTALTSRRRSRATGCATLIGCFVCWACSAACPWSRTSALAHRWRSH